MLRGPVALFARGFNLGYKAPVSPNAISLPSRAHVVANARVEGLSATAEVESDGARLIQLSSTDRTGSSADARVREAVAAATRRFGASSSAFSEPLAALEERLASSLGHEAALVTHAALPVLLELARAHETVAVDSRTAPRLALPGQSAFLSPEDLLSAAMEHPLMIVAGALFPSEGDLGPVPRTMECAARLRGSLIVVDPAGFGVLGESGSGVIEHMGLQGQAALVVCALQSTGGSGWVVAGPRDVVAALRGVAEPPDVASVAATARALEIAEAEPQRRARLFALTVQFLTELRGLGFDTGPCVTPWIPVWLGEEAACQQWLAALREAGVFCHALLHGARSRLLLSPPATLSQAQASAALDGFARLARKLGHPVLAEQMRANPVLVARPGSYVLATPAAPHWFPDVSPAGPQSPPAPAAPLSDRIFDAIDTLTWRAASRPSPRLRHLIDVEAVLARLIRNHRS